MIDLNDLAANCGGVQVPKVVAFKEHIRILKEKDNEYDKLLNQYNESGKKRKNGFYHMVQRQKSFEWGGR